MPITSAHRVPHRPNPHCTHSDEPRDSRGAGVLAKLPRVALARNHRIAPAPAPRAAVVTARVLPTENANCRVPARVCGVEPGLAVRVAVAGGGLIAIKTACGTSPRNRCVEAAQATCVISASDGVPIKEDRCFALLRMCGVESGLAVRAAVAGGGLMPIAKARVALPPNRHAEPGQVACVRSGCSVVPIGNALLSFRRRRAKFGLASRVTVAEVA